MWLASISSKDGVVNVFDVVNFDMVNRMQLDFRSTRSSAHIHTLTPFVDVCTHYAFVCACELIRYEHDV
jgi:hypothetical protein